MSITPIYNVAQFITAAIELGLDTWPREFRMRGDFHHSQGATTGMLQYP
jgi:hypothetical protein